MPVDITGDCTPMVRARRHLFNPLRRSTVVALVFALFAVLAPTMVADAATASAVQNLAAVGDYTPAVTVTWDAPADDGGQPVTDYRVTRFDGPDNTFPWAIVADHLADTTFVDTNVVAGSTYTYRVRPWNADGLGEITEVTVTVPTPTAPDPVQNLAGVALSATAGRITWQAPASDGGKAILDYFIRRNGPDGLVDVAPNHPTTTPLRFTDTGLLSSSLYTYSVWARNELGYSQVASVDITTRPDVVTGLVATTAWPPSVSLDWEAPAVGGGVAPTGYFIQRDGVTIAASHPSTDFTDTGLVNGTTYSYRVAALNDGGRGAFQTLSVVVDFGPGPTRPSITSPAANSMLAESILVTGRAQAGNDLELSDNGVVVATVPVDSDGNWAADLTLADGVHTLSAVSIDDLGRRSTARAVKVTIDAIAPSLTIFDADDAKFIAEPVVIDGAVLDNHSVVSVKTAYVQSHFPFLEQVGSPTCTGCGTASATFVDEPSLMPGHYDVYVSVLDGVGNETWKQIGVYVVNL